MRIPVDNLGRVGVIRDIYSSDTPPEAWTSVRNCRMGPYGAEKFGGHVRTIGTGSAGWTVAPVWLEYAPVAGAAGFWVGLGTTAIYARSATSPYTETNITRAVGGAYAATQDIKWNGGMFGGILVVNNGVDEPQYWVPNTANDMIGLSGYGTSPWPANYRCGVMKPFGRFLVAADITKAGTRYPQTIKWSHSADVGTLPASWSTTDPAVDAGEYPLQDAVGVPNELISLRDFLCIYTPDQTWRMFYTGGGDVFGFAPIFRQSGALSYHCVDRFKLKGAEMQAVLSGDDFFVHNGQAPQSVITPAMRRWFFQQIDATNYGRSFVVVNPVYNEVWVCVPEAGMQQPTLAMVWNWETGAIGFRDLLTATSNGDTRTTAATIGTPCIARGFITDTSNETWADSGTWETDTSTWNANVSSPATPRLLMADRSAGKRTFLIDSGSTFDETAITWSVERTSIALTGRDREGQPKNNSALFMLLTEIWPRFDAQQGEVFNFQIGVQDSLEDSVHWSEPYTYTVGTNVHIPVYHGSKYFSIRATNTTSLAAFKFLGYAFELSKGGYF